MEGDGATLISLDAADSQVDDLIPGLVDRWVEARKHIPRSGVDKIAKVVARAITP